MQDNNQHELDPQFVEHAWQQMKSMLDDEMPVRPLIIPWWRRLGMLFLLLFIATGLVGFSIYYLNQPTEIESPEIPAVPSNTPLSEQSPVAVLEEEPCPPETSETGELPQAITPTPTIAANPAGSEKIKASAAVPVSSLSSLAAGEQVEESLELTSSISSLQAKSFVAVPAENDNQSLVPESVPLIEPLKKSGVSFSLGAGLGALADVRPFQLSGMNVGVPMELQFNHSRWSLLTAPAYEVSRLNYQNREQVVSTKANRADETGGFSFSSGDTVLATVTALYGESSLNYTMHSFYLPLEAGFRISRRFRLEMGAGINILLSSGQSKSGVFDFSTARNDVESLPLAGNNAWPAVELPRVRQAVLNGALGISYLPTDRLRIHLKYRHDLSGLFPDSSRPNAHRFQVGASYLFR